MNIDAGFAIATPELIREYVHSPESGWCALLPGGAAVQLDRNPVAALALLETPLDVIEKLVAAGAPDARPFPYYLALEAAVTQGNEYWVSRAVRWLTDAKRRSLSWAEPALLTFVPMAKSKRYSQRLRQQIESLLSG